MEIFGFPNEKQCLSIKACISLGIVGISMEIFGFPRESNVVHQKACISLGIFGISLDNLELITKIMVGAFIVFCGRIV